MRVKAAQHRAATDLPFAALQPSGLTAKLARFFIFSNLIPRRMGAVLCPEIGGCLLDVAFQHLHVSMAQQTLEREQISALSYPVDCKSPAEVVKAGLRHVGHPRPSPDNLSRP